MECPGTALTAASAAFLGGLALMWRMRLGILDAWMRAMPDLKPWWKSRTLWVNAIVLLLATAEMQLQILQPVLPINSYQLLAFALPVLNAVLRLVTSQGLAPR